MTYIILLHDERTRFETEIEVLPRMSMSHFLDIVRREMSLPYDESVEFRQTIAQGHIYMRDADTIYRHCEAVSDGMYWPDSVRYKETYNERTYTPEKGVRVEDLFTVIGSACRYIQGRESVRCTLIERLPSSSEE